ncbi:unnamed protein product [Heterobilharzia americana]|nr:unnamed protein product [Heterobilharzia americana]
MTGYILTYNRHEHLARIEAYRLLNHTLDEISNKCAISNPKHTSEGSADNSVNTDIEHIDPKLVKGNNEDADADNLYVQLLRENCSTFPTNSRNKFSFYSLKTHISNCSFILHQTDLVCASALCHRIFERLLSTTNAESRHVLRLMPVVNTCHSDLPTLYTSVQQIWSKFLGLSTDDLNSKNSNSPKSETITPSDQPYNEEGCKLNSNKVSVSNVPTQIASEETLRGPKTFMIIFKSRGFDAINRDDAIHCTAKAIKTVDQSWQVCHTSPSVVISITVLCKVTCISLLENFFKYRKYNVAEVCSPSHKTNCINTIDKNDQSE